MRSLGEAVGHIIKAIRTDPAKRKQTVRKTIEEQQRGDMILRRTTIEEVEITAVRGGRATPERPDRGT